MHKFKRIEINNLICFGFINIISFGIIYYKFNKTGVFRYSLLIPKIFVNHAVDRNKIKRLIKVFFISNLMNIKNYDVLILVNQNINVKNNNFFYI